MRVFRSREGVIGGKVGCEDVRFGNRPQRVQFVSRVARRLWDVEVRHDLIEAHKSVEGVLADVFCRRYRFPGRLQRSGDSKHELLRVSSGVGGRGDEGKMAEHMGASDADQSDPWMRTLWGSGVMPRTSGLIDKGVVKTSERRGA